MLIKVLEGRYIDPKQLVSVEVGRHTLFLNMKDGKDIAVPLRGGYVEAEQKLKQWGLRK